MRAHHHYAGIFPMMEETDLANLAADIKANGLRELIWVDHEGRIIDGRNRLLACERAGVEPRFRVWPGDDAAVLAFVLSANLHRRHLTLDQRGAVAAELAKLPVGRPSSREIAPRDAVSFSDAEAAAAMDVSERTVERGKALMREAPDLHEKVKAGEMKAGEARREAAQRKAVEKEQEQPEPEDAQGEKIPFDWTADTLTRINEVINLTKWGAKTTAAEIDPSRRAVIAKKAEKAHRWLRMLARELNKLEQQDLLRGWR